MILNIDNHSFNIAHTRNIRVKTYSSERKSDLSEDKMENFGDWIDSADACAAAASNSKEDRWNSIVSGCE